MSKYGVQYGAMLQEKEKENLFVGYNLMISSHHTTLRNIGLVL